MDRKYEKGLKKSGRAGEDGANIIPVKTPTRESN